MRNGFIVLLAAGLGLSVVALVARAAPRDTFVGTWTVTITPTDGGKPIEDTLTFTKGGKFSSAYFKPRGFEETDFDADTRGRQIQTFTANATSKKEGSTKWTGTAAAGQMQGTLSWTKGDGSVVEYSYMGPKK
jgi:hypothetical protein